MENWGLQALITPNEYDEEHHHHHHHHHHHRQQQQQQHHIHQDHDDGFGSIDIKKEYDQALLFCFPHLFDQHENISTMETNVLGDELDQLYKPFYPVYGTENEFSSSSPPPPPDFELHNTYHYHHRHHSEQDVKKDQEQNIKNICGSSSNTSQLAPKLKKRKNQQKRVVVQVTSDGLSSDPWAWRKYGQKPIKGSIYPRSYYRCSSSKACMARRQVEQSCTDSNIYILTYTADHNHPQPTRRNSLAGINRNRFKATPKSPTLGDDVKTVTKSKDSPFHSPTTPSVSSIDDEVLQQSNIKQETMFYNKYFYDQGHTMMAGINDDNCMVFTEDFFDGLEDLGGYTIDSSSYNSLNNQFRPVFS